MSAFSAGAATYAVLFTLMAAVLGHVRRPSALVSALAAHRVLRWPTTVTAAVMVAESALVAALLLGVLLPSPGVLAVGLGGAAALFAGYGSYAGYVVATGRSGPCGCGGGSGARPWSFPAGGTTGGRTDDPEVSHRRAVRSGAEVAMSGWVAGRAFALTVLAAGALAWSDTVAGLSGGPWSSATALPDGGGSSLLLVVLAGATFGCLLWRLPAAMYDPTGARPPAGVRP